MLPEKELTEAYPPFQEAAHILQAAAAWVIAAGAGMGVDSGLPDFRGPQGFWRAYPPYRKLGLDFYSVANPEHFARDPAFAWGFYGHRLAMYRRTQPHPGFRILLELAGALGLEPFVVTSNVDGHFQKAGFPSEQVLEVHGSIHHLQCVRPCSQQVWENDAEVTVTETSMRALDWPHCPHCSQVARPNILMFGDACWVSRRSDAQANNFQRFLDAQEAGCLAVVELGAGTAVPTIRNLSARLIQRWEARLIRVNPREPETGGRHVSLPCSALSALRELKKLLWP